MFMTQAQIASQIWRIGPLLTHSLMVTAQLSLSLCLLCSQILQVWPLHLQSYTPSSWTYRNVWINSIQIRRMWSFLLVNPRFKELNRPLCFTFSLTCDYRHHHTLLLLLFFFFFYVWPIRGESEKWTQLGSLHTVSPCYPPTLYCLLMEAVVIVMQ